jgi:hypothetical protein
MKYSIFLIIILFLYSCSNLPTGANRTRVDVDYSNWNIFSSKHKNTRKSIEAHLIGQDWVALSKDNYQYKFWFEDFDVKNQDNDYLISLKFQLRNLEDSTLITKFETINYKLTDELVQKTKKQVPPSLDISDLENDELVLSVLVGQKSVKILKDMLIKVIK